jgi:hypothetical protein
VVISGGGHRILIDTLHWRPQVEMARLKVLDDGGVVEAVPDPRTHDDTLNGRSDCRREL